MGFLSGLSLGHFKKRSFDVKHYKLVLVVYAGLLSCSKVNVFSRFSSWIALHLAFSIVASSLTSFLVLANENHIRRMMLPPTCFTVGMVCSQCCLVLVHHTVFCIMAKKVSFGLTWPDHILLCLLFCNLSFCNYFIRTDLWSTWLITVLWM